MFNVLMRFNQRLAEGVGRKLATKTTPNISPPELGPPSEREAEEKTEEKGLNLWRGKEFLAPAASLSANPFPAFLIRGIQPY